MKNLPLKNDVLPEVLKAQDSSAYEALKTAFDVGFGADGFRTVVQICEGVAEFYQRTAAIALSEGMSENAALATASNLVSTEFVTKYLAAVAALDSK